MRCLYPAQLWRSIFEKIKEINTILQLHVMVTSLQLIGCLMHSRIPGEPTHLLVHYHWTLVLLSSSFKVLNSTFVSELWLWDESLFGIMVSYRGLPLGLNNDNRAKLFEYELVFTLEEVHSRLSYCIQSILNIFYNSLKYWKQVWISDYYFTCIFKMYILPVSYRIRVCDQC